ncbi:3',5'-cyclic-nucleotide phosphodiesterase [Curvibacter sp. HBC28]|uniref:3',5'-cyclic-nucleotide phosphodiesterase n=1 Tax=Curvibacter microcysteis TaxID=3026419 RepID=A0ABT5MHR7_9BURK|nr:3',5'-cyclic-nucleotide phosphodiesterase [Curvibacter sp. HBC28]MDD0816112.1 3',5'-cyclic-nucleotide phosphodiesterase [Curvibacter sp. HBC28]
MRIRVLGCSGAIARNCRTTSFLVNEQLLIDAGTGVGDLTLDEMARINDVFLTHSHLDHIAALPLMLDSVAKLRHTPLRVRGLPATLQALRQHVFNDVIWPDFTRLPSADKPFLTLHPFELGEQLPCADVQIEVLPACHAVPAVGFAVDGGHGAWVFSGDTGGDPRFWARVQQLSVKALVIETAFGEAEHELAVRSGHLSPITLIEELRHLPRQPDYPIHITHTKPSETADIAAQLQALEAQGEHPVGWPLCLKGLQAGDEFII